MDQIADLQAQIVALRVALEGAWLSMLHSGPKAIENAERLHRDNVAGLRQLDASTPEARATRDAVIVHTEQLWKSIIWQLGGEPEGDQRNPT